MSKVENVADDDGMKRRLLIMPFTQSFTGSNCNPRLKTILMDEKNMRGLLRILVAEARAWYLAADAKKCGLIISAEMTTATKENIQANDFLSDALDEFFVRDEKAPDESEPEKEPHFCPEIICVQIFSEAICTSLKAMSNAADAPD